MAAVRRVYCWRVGWVFPLAEGEKCPECSSINHKTHVKDTCGGYAPSRAKENTGHPCELSIGHSGDCEYDLDHLVMEVLEQ